MSFFFLKNEQVSGWERREGRTSGGVGRADSASWGVAPLPCLSSFRKEEENP